MFWVFSVNAQSKKEQIENLNYRIDSLNQVLLKEKKLNTNSADEITILYAQLYKLNASISSLNAEVSKLTSSLKSNQEELSKLQAKLKVKSDSLLLVQKELNKLKPPPIQINNTPAVVSLQKGPYKTVQIGTQVWMIKNLDVATFRNGDPIPEAKTNEEWKKADENHQPAWCYYDNDPKNGAKYGKLYNMWALYDPRGIAPEGFHVPSVDDWEKFDAFVNSDATRIKSISGWNSWDEPTQCSNCSDWNTEYRRKNSCQKCLDTRLVYKKNVSGNGTNSTGFSALPGGCRYDSGEFSFSGDCCELLSTGSRNYKIWQSDDCWSDFEPPGRGGAIRCIKD